jgi:hypothetical protein
MLPRVLVTCAVLIIAASPSFADEPLPATSIQVYHVGDLVSVSALHESVQGQVSPTEWRSEHAETIQSLNRLASLMTALGSTKSAKVEAYPETLSLVARNTAEGHREIAELLNLLRSGNEPSIRLTCQPLCDPEGTHIQSLPEDKKKRLGELLTKKTLTADEVRELKEHLREPGYEIYDQTIQLVAGRKASWGIPGRPAMATACVVPGKQSIRLRLDYVVDDIADKVPVASQVFEIETGASVISYHTCDGGTTVWLITPTMIEPRIAGHSTANVK